VSIYLKLGDKMKKILFSSLVGFALIALSGCTSGSDAEVTNASKCKAGKCDSAKKCQASGKCGGDMAKKVAKKCKASGKCG